MTGFPEALECTCGNFHPRRGCEHLDVVQELFGPNQSEDASYDREERAAIQAEACSPQEIQEMAQNSASQMLIRRSVSPDGRIDSLFVEIFVPIGGIPSDEIKARSERTLKLQSDIVGRFLEKQYNGNGNGKANGKTLKLFGSKKQLSDRLRDGGYPQQAGSIQEGIALGPSTAPTRESRAAWMLWTGSRRPTRWTRCAVLAAVIRCRSLPSLNSGASPARSFST